jgi:hypothetical protein
MSKRAKIVLGASGAIALAVILGVCAFRDRRPGPATTSVQAPVVPEIQPAPAAAATKPALPPSTTAVAGPKLRRPAAPAAGRPLDEAALLAKINELGPSNLPLTVQLAREAAARFPDSPRAPEFEMNLAKALLHMGSVEEAREEARIMLKKYPDSPFTREVEHHLLTNPPNPTK